MFRKVTYFTVATDSIQDYTLIMANIFVSTGLIRSGNSGRKVSNLGKPGRVVETFF